MSTKLGREGGEAEETEGGGIQRENKNRGACVSVCVCVCVVCAYFGVRSKAVDAATGVCVPALQRSACLPTCVSNERWTALLSILSSKISHDVTMNPSWTHLCQKALLQPSLSLPHFLFHLSLLHAPFLPLRFFTQLSRFFLSYFPIPKRSPLSSMSLFLSPLSLTHTQAHQFFFPFSFLARAFQLNHQKKKALNRQKCQDDLISVNFVWAVGFF